MVPDPELPLDSRLVQVALEVIQTDGLEGLSLRRIARQAGVSHGAPLRHYRSLADLLSEVASHGFRLLSETMDKSGAQLPADATPLDRIAAAGRAYAQVATEHAGLFALMFRPEDLDVENASFVRDSADAFEKFTELIRLAQDWGWNIERDPRLLAAPSWSALHGLAMPWSQGAISGVVPDATLEQAQEIIEELIFPDRQGGRA